MRWSVRFRTENTLDTCLSVSAGANFAPNNVLVSCFCVSIRDTAGKATVRANASAPRRALQGFQTQRVGRGVGA